MVNVCRETPDFHIRGFFMHVYKYGNKKLKKGSIKDPIQFIGQTRETISQSNFMRS